MLGEANANTAVASPFSWSVLVPYALAGFGAAYLER